jgi:hypothetical protein
MANRSPIRACGLLLGAAALASCGGGDASAETAALRGRIDAQSAEIEALRKSARESDARMRLLEEKVAAAPAVASAQAPAGAAVVAKAAPPGATGAAAAPAPSPAAEAVAAFLDTEEGRLKIREAMQAEEKRKAEAAEKEQHDRMVGFIKERITGTLTEQLGLDATQQQTLITVASDTMDRMTEVWRGMRDARGDPNFFAQAREKSQEIRKQAMDKVQQALTAEQYNKLQDVLNDGGSGLLFGGGRGMGPGGQPGGAQGGGAGGAGGGAGGQGGR